MKRFSDPIAQALCFELGLEMTSVLAGNKPDRKKMELIVDKWMVSSKADAEQFLAKHQRPENENPDLL